MRTLRVRRGRVSVVMPRRTGWIAVGAALIAAYMVVMIPLALWHLRHDGSLTGVLPVFALLGLGMVLPGALLIARLGLGRSTPVITLLADDDAEGGVLLAVVDAERQLREFLVRPRTAGQCRAALGAPPPAERV